MLIKTDSWDVVTQNKSLNYMLFCFSFWWIYQFPNATNNTLILMMQKSRKLSLFLKQTKSNYFFLKQLSNFLKVPKVHFDRTRSMKLANAQWCTGSDHTEQRRNKKNQATDWKQQEILLNLKNKNTLFCFVFCKWDEKNTSAIFRWSNRK